MSEENGERCLVKLEWMRTNMLRYNDEIIVVLFISTPYLCDRLHDTQLRIGDAGV